MARLDSESCGVAVFTKSAEVFKAKSIRTGELVAMKQMKIEGSVLA